MATGRRTGIQQVASLLSDEKGFVFRISFERVSPIEREKRVAQARAVVRSTLERDLGVELEVHEESISLRFDHAEEEAIRRLADRINDRVSEILTAPLPPKAVDRALGIAAHERIRWYKDGRLRICGREAAGRSGRTRVPLFPFAEIARLRAMPEIIEGWRRDDVSSATSPG
jgi:hypothetical protein